MRTVLLLALEEWFPTSEGENNTPVPIPILPEKQLVLNECPLSTMHSRDCGIYQEYRRLTALEQAFVAAVDTTRKIFCSNPHAYPIGESLQQRGHYNHISIYHTSIYLTREWLHHLLQCFRRREPECISYHR